MVSFLIRNAQARQLIEYFWISAVVTIFAIRIFLYVTGYPQLGGDSLHIAHMLWGGLLMGAANIMMLAFLNRGIKMAGAVVGGVGFGTFIDELGKFITHDNNYFFQPTILLLYLIFVGLFFLAKQIEIWFPLDKQEYLVNSLELLKDVAMEDLDSEEKKAALSYLQKVQADNQLETVLISTFNAIEPLPIQTDPVLVRVAKWGHTLYKKAVANTLFAKVMIVVFVLASVDNFALLFYPDFMVVTVSEWGVVISTLVSLLFIFQAAFFFKKNKRLLAFEALKTATLVSIFLVQLFLFYIQQLTAAIELFGAIVSLQVLQLMIDQEKKAER